MSNSQTSRVEPQRSNPLRVGIGGPVGGQADEHLVKAKQADHHGHRPAARPSQARFFVGPMRMQLTVNGETHEHRGSGTLRELLQELGAEPARVAVVVNDEVVPRDRRDALRLRPADRVEVLAFAGGG